MEPIKWHALTPEQRNALIAEKVMNWQERQCDGEWAEVSGGWFCTKCGHDGNWGDSFEHAELPPRYSQSMDAAWLVLQNMVERYEQKAQQFFDFAGYMFDASGWDRTEIHGDVYPGFHVCIMAAQWTPDAICIAALRAMGYAVLTEEAKAAG